MTDSVTSKNEVEFACGHSVSHEESCPRCEIERLTRVHQNGEALQQLARGLEAYVMDGRDGDAFDLAILVDNLVCERLATTLGARAAHETFGSDWQCVLCGRPWREHEPFPYETMKRTFDPRSSTVCPPVRPAQETSTCPRCAERDARTEALKQYPRRDRSLPNDDPPSEKASDGWRCMTCGYENPKGALRCQNSKCTALSYSSDLCRCRDVLVVNGKCNQCGKPIRFSEKAKENLGPSEAPAGVGVIDLAGRSVCPHCQRVDGGHSLACTALNGGASR